jgi:hypothetical protein
MVQEEARIALNVVACTLQLCSLPAYMLFDYGVMCFFDPNKLVEKLGKKSMWGRKKTFIQVFFRKKM